MLTPSPLPQYKVIVADDHQLIRDGLVLILKLIKSIIYIDQAADGNQVMSLLAKPLSFDIIFMDIDMPAKNGIETTREVKKQYPQIKVIALSMYNDQKHVLDMFSAGANAYLLKSTVNKKEVETAILEVTAGRQYYGNGLAGSVIDQALQDFRNRASDETGVHLQPKEIEVLQLIYQELNNKQIADRMQAPLRSIEGYRQSLFTKTKSQNLAGLIKFAIRNGYTGTRL